MDGLNPTSVEPVNALSALLSAVDEANLVQDPEVLGGCRLLQPERYGYFPGRATPSLEAAQDLAALRLGDGVERIRGGGGACDVGIIFRYRKTSTQQDVVSMGIGSAQCLPARSIQLRARALLTPAASATWSELA